MLEQSNTGVDEVLDRCSRYAPLGARGRLRSPEIGIKVNLKAKAHRIGGTCLYSESLCADRSQVVRIPLLEMLSLALFGGFCARRYQSKRAEGVRRGVRKVQHLARAGVRHA